MEYNHCRLVTKSFYGSKTRSYVNPLERSKLTSSDESDAKDIYKIKSPPQVGECLCGLLNLQYVIVYVCNV